MYNILVNYLKVFILATVLYYLRAISGLGLFSSMGVIADEYDPARPCDYGQEM